MCRCPGDEDCCCCSVGSHRQNVTACAGDIFARWRVLQHRVLRQHRLLQQHVLLLCCCCSCCSCSCCCRRCSSTRGWWSTRSHPTESLVEQNCESSGYWKFMCLMGRKQLSHGILTGKNNGKSTTNVKRITPAYAHVRLSTKQHMGRPVKSTGRPT